MAKEDRLPVFMDVTLNGSYHERMVFELFYDIAPFTAENFRALCTGEKGVSPRTNEYLFYAKCFFHKVKKNSSYVVGGAFCHETGEGGESIYGPHFRVLESNSLKHDREGLLSMSREQLASSSHFIITLRADQSLDRSHVIFGKLVEGFGTLRAIEHSCFWSPIKVTYCGLLYNANDIPPDLIVRSCWPPQGASEDRAEGEGKMKKRKEGKMILSVGLHYTYSKNIK